MSKPKTKVQRKKLKWVVEFEVDPIWVADGFNLDNDDALEMLMKRLSWCRSDEIAARIVKTPDLKVIKGLQNGSIGFPGDDDGNK